MGPIDTPTAIRMAQAFIGAFQPELRVDGYWGSYTQTAYDALSKDAKSQLDRILANVGQSVAAIRAMMGNLGSNTRGYLREEARNVRGNRVTYAELNELIDRAIAEVGWPYGKSAVQELVSLEAARVPGGFNAAAVNSLGYTGLGQFGRSTWEGLTKNPVIAGKIGSFSEGAKDPYKNLLATLYLGMENAKYLKSRGVTKIGSRELYALHQQGPANGLAMLRGSKQALGKQSATSLAFITGATPAPNLLA